MTALRGPVIFQVSSSITLYYLKKVLEKNRTGENEFSGGVPENQLLEN